MTAADSNVELNEDIYTYDENRIYTTSSVTAREDCEYRHYMDCQIAE